MFLLLLLFSLSIENNKISVTPVSLGKTKHFLQQIKTFPLFCGADVENALFSLVLFLHKHAFSGER